MFAIIIFLCCSCNATRLAKQKRGPYVNKFEALKDYAFCRCLILGFKSDSLQLSDASIGVIYELSDYSISLADSKRLDSFVKSSIENLAPLQPADYEGKKAIILTCIELYKSKALKKLSAQ